METTINFRDLGTTNEFPKTLEIRNERGGMIWQIYHVNNIEEATILSNVATSNGFMDVSLVDFDNTYEENFKGWRDTSGWQELWNEKGNFMNYAWLIEEKKRRGIWG